MNKLPYYYDELWKEHEIEYLEFNGYKYIEDLSYIKDNCKSIILLFNYNNVNLLRGYSNGILFPLINNFDINNINYKKRKKELEKIYNYIIDICKKYDIKNTKLYMNHCYSFSLNHSLFSIIKVENKQLLSLCHYNNNFDKHYNPLNIMKSNTKNIINKYLKKKKFTDIKINIYFGSIPDNIMNNFINKHFILAGKKTKSDKCWDIIKNFIIQKKSILIEGNNNFIYYFISDNYCYYAFNACDKKSDICTILLYEGMKWIFNNGYNFVNFGNSDLFYDNEKMINIQKYKKGLCNKIFTNYYVDL